MSPCSELLRLDDPDTVVEPLSTFVTQPDKYFGLDTNPSVTIILSPTGLWTTSAELTTAYPEGKEIIVSIRIGHCQFRRRSPNSGYLNTVRSMIERFIYEKWPVRGRPEPSPVATLITVASEERIGTKFGTPHWFHKIWDQTMAHRAVKQL